MTSAAVKAKAARHVVTPVADPPGFAVKSAESGRVYMVTLRIEGVVGTAQCTCRWATERPNGSMCSHVLAVHMYAEEMLKQKTQEVEKEEEF